MSQPHPDRQSAPEKYPLERAPQRRRTPAERAGQTWQGVEAEYTGGEDHPLGGYLGAMGVYAALVATLAGAARLSRRPLPHPTPWDVVICAGATHRLSRLVARDPVTSPLRAPFTVFEGQEGPAELKEEVRGHGARKAVGELITCPFCLDLWVATGLTAGYIYLPRATRLAVDTLAVLSGADLLQFAYALLQEQEQS